MARPHRGSEHVLRPQRIFTDRHDLRALIAERLADPGGARVINVYGHGGVGKSRLLEQVRHEHPGVTVGKVDFRTSHHRTHEGGLVALRHSLAASSHLKFPNFDVAFAVLWQKSHPHLPLSKSELPFLGQSEILGDILSAAGATPFLGLAVNLLKVTASLKDWNRERRTRISAPELEALDEKAPHEVAEYLPHFLALDLVQQFAKGEEPVLMFDTYEDFQRSSLQVAGSLGGRSWVCDLASEDFPGLVLIASRESLRHDGFWNDWTAPDIIFHPLGDLTDDYSDEFLIGCGLTNEDIRQVIINGSAGTPFYLNLSLDLFEQISRERIPTAEDFGQTTEELLARFISHVPEHDVAILQLLAVARWWTKPTFSFLAREFNIPVPLTRYDEICEYSFNAEADFRRWVMHDLMRRALSERLALDVQNDVHRALYKHLFELVEDSSLQPRDRLEYIAEAIYHGLVDGQILPQQLFDWGEEFLRAGYWERFDAILGESLRVLASVNGGEISVLSELLRFLRAWTLQARGQLQEALGAFSALSYAELGSFAGYARFRQADALRETGKLAEAGAAYEELATVEDASLARAASIQLADYMFVRGQFARAQELLEKLMDSPELHEKERADALRIRAHVERFTGSWTAASAAYRSAMQLHEVIGEPFGLARCRTNLAEVNWLVNPALAVELSHQAIAANAEVGSLVEVAKAHEAQAMGLAVLGEVDAALQSSLEAATLMERIGYLPGLSLTLTVRGLLCFRAGLVGEAEQELRNAERLLIQMSCYPTMLLIMHEAADFTGHEGLRPELERPFVEGIIQWPSEGVSLDEYLHEVVVALLGNISSIPVY